MCELCNKIYNKEELIQWVKESCGCGWFISDISENIIALEKNEYYFYTAIDDYYYTPQTAFKINYCPICGRKLAKDV